MAKAERWGKKFKDKRDWAGYSAKLIQFNPEYWREFVDVEGWRYYWLANRFSFNFGYEEEYRGMRDLMRGYAYSAKQYLFLNILKEYKEK